MAFRCPHCCHLAVEIEDASDVNTCPACGRSVIPATNVATAAQPAEGPVTQDDPRATTPYLSGSASPPTVPGYEILELLGRGGMGVVYRARQVSLKRIVALKMIRGGVSAGPTDLTRFRTEAEALARLQHPHIVQVHETGEHDDLPYFSLEYIGGGTLKEYLAGIPLPGREAAVLTETLARAVAAAHEQGIIHRDLKPGNILLAGNAPSRLTPQGERPPAATLVPKIADFGLAKRLHEDSGLTQTGQVMGTPCYMAPEQAAGAGERIGPLVDVYALGALLYEMLTGRPPFQGASILDTLEQVRSQEPVLPRLLNNRVPRDLETICLKAMAKEPGRRYQAAVDLADDLQRYLRGEPIRARASTAWERGVKWARRHPAPAALLAVSVLALLTILGVVAVDNRRVSASLQQMTQAKEEAEARLELSLRSQCATRLMLVATLWKSDPVTGRQLLEGPEQFPPRLRDFTWGYFHRLCDREQEPLRGHQGAISVVRCSPDGQTLATAGTDRTVRLWGPVTGQERAVLRGHTDRVTLLAFSRDGTVLASASDDRTIKLWEVATAKERTTLKGHGNRVSAVAITPDGVTVVSASLDGTVRLWDARTGAERASVTFPSDLRTSCRCLFARRQDAGPECLYDSCDLETLQCEHGPAAIRHGSLYSGPQKLDHPVSYSGGPRKG